MSEPSIVSQSKGDVAREPALPDGFESVSCPLCGATSAEIALRGTDQLHDSRTSLTIVRCAACRMCYLNPRPRGERLADYYPQDYHAHQRQRGDVVGGGVSTWLRRVALRMLYARPQEKPKRLSGALARYAIWLRGSEHFGAGLPVRGQGRLLDFGCGHGALLRRMQIAGWSVVGLDFSEQAVNAVRADGIEAYRGTLPHEKIAPHSFDAVVMQHALEHVPDPLAVLSAARQVLRPGGTLLVVVPNFAAWEVQQFGDAAIQIDLPRHLLHFERATLQKMLERAGFGDVKVQARPRRAAVRNSIAAAAARGHKIQPHMHLKKTHNRICRENAGSERGSELWATARAR